MATIEPGELATNAIALVRRVAIPLGGDLHDLIRGLDVGVMFLDLVPEVNRHERAGTNVVLTGGLPVFGAGPIVAALKDAVRG